MNIFISEALISLRPGAQFSIINDDYSTLQWLEPPVWNGGQSKPSLEEVQAEALRLEQEWQKNEYQRLRKPQYPPITDQLDMLYHLGYEGWKNEINKIKEMYPKPEN